MRIDQELQRLLTHELCAILDGWAQHEAAALLHLRQPHISLLRAGKPRHFSVARLLRLISACGYNLDIHIKARPHRFGPDGTPTVSVVRYDRFGRTVPGPK